MATYFGNGIVWDAEKNKVLCKFENQMFKTTDEYIKNKLDKLGYVSDSSDEIVVVDKVLDENMSEDEIRKKAKALGIKSWHVKSIENILKEIEVLKTMLQSITIVKSFTFLQAEFVLLQFHIYTRHLFSPF